MELTVVCCGKTIEPKSMCRTKAEFVCGHCGASAEVKIAFPQEAATALTKGDEFCPGDDYQPGHA
jgi:hypothetical protein